MVMIYMYIYIFLESYKKRRDIEIFSRRRRDVSFSLWEAIPCARRKSGGFHEMRWSGDPLDENAEKQYAVFLQITSCQWLFLAMIGIPWHSWIMLVNNDDNDS